MATRAWESICAQFRKLVRSDLGIICSPVDVQMVCTTAGKRSNLRLFSLHSKGFMHSNAESDIAPTTVAVGRANGITAHEF